MDQQLPASDNPFAALQRSPPAASPATAAALYPPPPTSRAQTALERLASAKKGKGRADRPHGRDVRDPTAPDDDDGPAGMSFSIRFTEGQEDLVDLWVGEKESVREVKRRVRHTTPAAPAVLHLSPAGSTSSPSFPAIDPLPPSIPNSRRSTPASPSHPTRPPPHGRNVLGAVHRQAPLPPRAPRATRCARERRGPF